MYCKLLKPGFGELYGVLSGREVAGAGLYSNRGRCIAVKDFPPFFVGDHQFGIRGMGIHDEGVPGSCELPHVGVSLVFEICTVKFRQY